MANVNQLDSKHMAGCHPQNTGEDPWHKKYRAILWNTLTGSTEARGVRKITENLDFQ